MTRIVSTLVGLLLLLGLQRFGQTLSLWLGIRLPGSFWGFLVLWLWLASRASVPAALAHGSAFLLTHLPLFLLPSLVAAVAALQLGGREAALLVCGVPVTLLMAAACARVIATLQRPQPQDTHGA